MHGSFDKRHQDQQHNYQSFSIKLIALPVLVIVAMIAVLVSRPAAVQWISDAAEAEFIGTDLVPDVAPQAQMAEHATKSGR
ncbi:hypothetical protein JQ633_04325 [Bradyrhizobium tropiciagri]|uniref:hypothetical protein n=1 Tax=Bradyrhizobium tropiciagri TaxID=312253 RepID=UPI001BA795B1|nr:hypothetical protein [Bradyrhizobium tropiciagri]MBR0869573.1 hypothetical protein [Bradyrhizobium tropiciagri]